MNDIRFYLTSGSRWRFTAPYQRDIFQKGDEFEVLSFSSNTGMMHIHSRNPATHTFPTESLAKRFDKHPSITGALRADVVARRIEMVDAGKGKTYFVKTRDGNHLRDDYLILGPPSGAKLWSTERGAFSYILSTGRLRAKYVADHIAVYGFDPITERDYEIPLPEWKMRVLRLSQEKRGGSSVFARSVWSMKTPPVFGEVNEWLDVHRLAKSLSVPAMGNYLVFQNEEEAIAKKMQVTEDLRLFTA